MIQLWSDTFAMHENEFKSIIEAYRTLRYEGSLVNPNENKLLNGIDGKGVKFPERNFKDKFMIKFEGTKSPILEVLENNYQADVEVPKAVAQGRRPDPKPNETKKKYPKKVKTGPDGKDEIEITPELIKMITSVEVSTLTSG